MGKILVVKIRRSHKLIKTGSVLLTVILTTVTKKLRKYAIPFGLLSNRV